MFGRNKNNDEASSAPVEPTSTGPTGKKGRPTPKRKVAEARNYHPLVPADRKEAKRAAREARNARFAAEQEALVTGDERYLPARDKGRVRRYVRDYVDARHSFSEWIMVIMLVALVLIMVLSTFANRIPLHYQSFILYGSTALMYGSFLIMGVESFIVWRILRRKLGEHYPHDDIPRGTGYYAFSRMIFLRRWRSPRPQVRRGEFPK